MRRNYNVFYSPCESFPPHVIFEMTKFLVSEMWEINVKLVINKWNPLVMCLKVNVVLHIYPLLNIELSYAEITGSALQISAWIVLLETCSDAVSVTNCQKHLHAPGQYESRIRPASSLLLYAILFSFIL